MTAEVTVMNRQAVALAADSAVTVTTARGSRKAWPTVTKIFAMPAPHSVALMMYGSTSLHRLPWETIIKGFAQSLPTTPHSTLADYRTTFLRYLRAQRTLYPPREQHIYVYAKLVLEYLDLRGDIEGSVKEALANSPKTQLTPAEQRKVITEVLDAWQNGLNRQPRLKRLPRDFRRRFSAEYRTEMRQAKQRVFQKMPLTPAQSRRLTTIGHLLFEREWLMDGHSGIVVTGFGEDDMFPTLHQLRIEGFALNYLVLLEGDPTRITRDNTASVRAFAQGDDVYAFMEGVQPRYRNKIEEILHHRVVELPQEVLDSVAPSTLSAARRKKLKDDLFNATLELYEQTLVELGQFRTDQFVAPVVNVVSALPIEDLAVMAETLVNLTSFRQKVSMSVETVGGPVDVAVISKGDGFIWIKRKNYYALDQNPRVLAKYFA
ncbi:MAG: hypothetical protein KGL94_05740 [Acidobacteriota bacterium]|nr:hypothetical protein [Acidobacteriota bacterium]